MEGLRRLPSTDQREEGSRCRARCPDRLPERDCRGYGWHRLGDYMRPSPEAAAERAPAERPDNGRARSYDTRRVFRFMKSIKMNWPSVMVLVK